MSYQDAEPIRFLSKSYEMFLYVTSVQGTISRVDHPTYSMSFHTRAPIPIFILWWVRLEPASTCEQILLHQHQWRQCYNEQFPLHLFTRSYRDLMYINGGFKVGGDTPGTCPVQFFSFLAAFRKIDQNNGLVPPALGLAPLSWKSWIRHCTL